MTFGESMTALKLKCGNDADKRRTEAKAKLQEADDLSELHRGPEAVEFRRGEKARLKEEARRDEIEAQIHDRRKSMQAEGHFPNGPDEFNDNKWMGDVQWLFSEAHAAGMTRSSGDSLRDWM